ncbi:uncharacterized protein EV420DRAFT_1749054 [Desarmillaria tabescens]|uniref:Uncharacterized protein n=1 Tax=Armillaria tabescens TaxID=1929756 RepID=A0AA39K6Q6_ARMTA|nr:uncharacterized protein EV420DRAFT_1749054 [Desarmillaria tabescens]KAK0455594.1 hypothetical protein EV420DRAFT_1749054 [Desarmillaria tabescens]
MVSRWDKRGLGLTNGCKQRRMRRRLNGSSMLDGYMYLSRSNIEYKYKPPTTPHASQFIAIAVCSFTSLKSSTEVREDDVDVVCRGTQEGGCSSVGARILDGDRLLEYTVLTFSAVGSITNIGFATTLPSNDASLFTLPSTRHSARPQPSSFVGFVSLKSSTGVAVEDVHDFAGDVGRRLVEWYARMTECGCNAEGVVIGPRSPRFQIDEPVTLTTYLFKFRFHKKEMIISRLRKAEVKWAQRSLVAFVLLLVVGAGVGLGVRAVTKD